MMINSVSVIIGIMLLNRIDAVWYALNTTYNGWTEEEIPNPFTYPLDSNDGIIGRTTSSNPSYTLNSTIRFKWDFIEHDSTDYAIFSVSTDSAEDTWKGGRGEIGVTIANHDGSYVDVIFVLFGFRSANDTHFDQYGIHDNFINRTEHDGPVLRSWFSPSDTDDDRTAGGSKNIDMVMYRINNEGLTEFIFARPVDGVDDDELDLSVDPDIGNLIQAFAYEYSTGGSYGTVQRNISWWANEPENVKEFVGVSNILLLMVFSTMTVLG